MVRITPAISIEVYFSLSTIRAKKTIRTGSRFRIIAGIVGFAMVLIATKIAVVATTSTIPIPNRLYV
jgi:hypothetical protein